MKYKKRQEWFLDNEQELATIPSRILAMLIDIVIIVFIFYLIGKVFDWIGLGITNIKLINIFKKTIYDRILQRNGLDLMYDELERIYGSSEFLMISTPIFDSTYTKAIISVDLHCGSLCGQGNEFILEKQRGIWRIITVYYTWES